MTMSNLEIKFKQTVEGDIVIRIPRSYLRHAITIHEDMPEESRVTNTKIFSDAVFEELQRESEDGSNYIHTMLDLAILEAVEQGCEGVKLGDE